MPESRPLTMITGAGTSKSFGLPSTEEFTDLIATSLREDRRMSEGETSALALYDSIYSTLKDYLRRPGIVTFEDIYQSIQNIITIQGMPRNPTAFDEFRPRVGATHVLNNSFSSYSWGDGFTLQNYYLDNILTTFRRALSRVSETHLLSLALERIREKFLVWSFTLNYDNILSDALDGSTSGFPPGSAPRVFSPDDLLSALESPHRHPIHSHLHGSLKLGFPLEESLNRFELHEYDTPEDGVRHSYGSRPSDRPILSGETLPPSPIITGLSKTELVFKRPFFTNFLAFFRALELCTEVLIAGYGFRDPHINMGIEQFRRYRPSVSTYIVDRCDHCGPSSYIRSLTPGAWHAILPAQSFRDVEVPRFPGWWRVPGISGGGFNTGPIFLWLQGFDTFCKVVANDGLPEESE